MAAKDDHGHRSTYRYATHYRVRKPCHCNSLCASSRETALTSMFGCLPIPRPQDMSTVQA